MFTYLDMDSHYNPLYQKLSHIVGLHFRVKLQLCDFVTVNLFHKICCMSSTLPNLLAYNRLKTNRIQTQRTINLLLKCNIWSKYIWNHISFEPEQGSKLQIVVLVISPQSLPPFDASTKTSLYMVFVAFPHVLLQLIISFHSDNWQSTKI